MSTHHEHHFEGSAALRDIVIGMSDGLTVPFALAAGLSGAQMTNNIILTAGVAELIAGAISMGLGGYLAGKSEVEHYESEWKRESDEIETIPEVEKKEVRQILEKYGISSPTQILVVDELAKNKSHWLNFMMEFELGLQKPNAKLASQGALRIGLSYAIGGFIPLSAYSMTSDSYNSLILSTIMTLIALGIFGYVKSSFLHQPKLKGALRVILVGSMAAGVSFLVAKLIT